MASQLTESTQDETVDPSFEDDLQDFDASLLDEVDEEEEEIEDDPTIHEETASGEGEKKGSEVEEKEEEEVLDPSTETETVATEATDESGDTAVVDEDPLEILRSEITRLSAELTGLRSTPKSATIEDIASPLEIDEIDLINDIDIDDMLSDKKKFNTFLNNAIKQVLNVASPSIQVQSIEKMQLALPTIVASQINHQKVLDNAITKFYAENELLVPHKPLVASHIQTVASENPDWTLEQVMPEAASRAYKQLRLTQQINGDTKKTTSKVGQSGLRKPTRASSTQRKIIKGGDALQMEMDELTPDMI